MAVSRSRLMTDPAAGWGMVAHVRRLGLGLGLGLVPGGLSVILTVGAVCCQMDYGSDALAGLVVAGLAIALALFLHPREGRSARDS